jgi:hypothetical protein
VETTLWSSRGLTESERCRNFEHESRQARSAVLLIARNPTFKRRNNKEIRMQKTQATPNRSKKHPATSFFSSPNHPKFRSFLQLKNKALKPSKTLKHQKGTGQDESPKKRISHSHRHCLVNRFFQPIRRSRA